MLSKTCENLKETIDKIDGRIKLAFSHQIEDVIIIHLLQRIERLNRVDVFTLDTHKLFKESIEYQHEVEQYFGITIQVFGIKGEMLKKVDTEIGEWGMRESLEKRKECCHIRKILPLHDALKGASAWISGIRIAQSSTRAQSLFFENDKQFQLYKINPLFDWSDELVWEYAHTQQLPINVLYKQGFASIGCAPCTRAIKEGEDIRAGRWWWEDPEHKECGLHR